MIRSEVMASVLHQLNYRAHFGPSIVHTDVSLGLSLFIYLSISIQGDGRYLISNGKDQTLKLWDVRRFGSQEGMEQVRKAVGKSNWDYRWEAVPKRTMKKTKITGDVSVMTYRGHGVLHTLIRYTEGGGEMCWEGVMERAPKRSSVSVTRFCVAPPT